MNLNIQVQVTYNPTPPHRILKIAEVVVNLSVDLLLRSLKVNNYIPEASKSTISQLLNLLLEASNLSIREATTCNYVHPP